MSDTKYTSGPWGVDYLPPIRQSEGVWRITAAPTQAARKFSIVAYVKRDCADDAAKAAHAAADARLIAAAPQLLAACEDLLLSFGTTNWSSTHDLARIDYARKAVAAATPVAEQPDA